MLTVISSSRGGYIFFVRLVRMYIIHVPERFRYPTLIGLEPTRRRSSFVCRLFFF
jgi:hypothetical protein